MDALLRVCTDAYTSPPTRTTSRRAVSRPPTSGRLVFDRRPFLARGARAARDARGARAGPGEEGGSGASARESSVTMTTRVAVGDGQRLTPSVGSSESDLTSARARRAAIAA